MVVQVYIDAYFENKQISVHPNENNATVYLAANDLVELSNNSTYDKWSLGKTVVLMDDISLKGVDYKPIPYFSGIFDGQGYEISDFEDKIEEKIEKSEEDFDLPPIEDEEIPDFLQGEEVDKI